MLASIFTSHESTNDHDHDHDLVFQDQSPTSNYHHLPISNDQLYNFHIHDDDLFAMITSPNYQDFSFSNFTASFNHDPIIEEINTRTMDTINMQPPPKYLERMHGGSRIALRMKTELEIVDDGYRWRKYGKKKVKSSPNPRNYYKCWVAGCNVKKRVERDGDDSRYVITSYEGVHNHIIHSSSSTIHHYKNIHPRQWNFDQASIIS